MADGARTKSEWERLVEETCSRLSQAVSDLSQHLQDLVSLPDRISRQRLLVGLTTREGKQDREAVETLRRLERAEAEAVSRSSALRSAVTAALGRVRTLAGEVASALDSAEGTYTRLARGLKGRAYQWELESARRAWDGERQFFLGLQSRLRSAETGACQRVEEAEKRYAWMAAAMRGKGTRLPGDTTPERSGGVPGGPASERSTHAGSPGASEFPLPWIVDGTTGKLQ